MPSACPAMPIRPPSRVVMPTLKPSPGLPSIMSLGRRTSSMIRLPVEEARIPSLSSFLPTENPGLSVGTMKADSPLCFIDLSVVAMTMAACASCAFVIHALVPFSTHSSPSSRAVVLAAAASEPLPGSERPKQPSFCPEANGTSHCCFCCSVPYRSKGSQYRLLLTDMMTPDEAQPREISSIAMAYARESIPVPPYSSGTAIPINPRSAIWAICSAGKRCSRSNSPATGRSCASAKSRQVCRIMSYSSVSGSA
mmetsp:Transcript_15033/g.33619  ORF Transcript_15033/g.33619 Transcript_15033/m.33619 type:complete len:253 (+) Transcript_15033:752-1510(+)